MARLSCAPIRLQKKTAEARLKAQCLLAVVESQADAAERALLKARLDEETLTEGAVETARLAAASSFEDCMACKRRLDDAKVQLDASKAAVRAAEELREPSTESPVLFTPGLAMSRKSEALEMDVNGTGREVSVKRARFDPSCSLPGVTACGGEAGKEAEEEAEEVETAEAAQERKSLLHELFIQAEQHRTLGAEAAEVWQAVERAKEAESARRDREEHGQRGQELVIRLARLQGNGLIHPAKASQELSAAVNAWSHLKQQCMNLIDSLSDCGGQTVASNLLKRSGVITDEDSGLQSPCNLKTLLHSFE